MRSRMASVQKSLVVHEAGPDARLLVAARGTRALGDGFVSVLLPVHLLGLGFSTLQVGAIATATLLGSAALTLFIGLIAVRLNLHQLLVRAALLMIVTGFGFAIAREFWPMVIVAFVGTINPSGGDVSVFLPTEQALLTRTVPSRRRTDLFARYSLIGSSMAAIGSLISGLPQWVADRTSISLTTAIDGMFLIYSALGLVSLLIYRHLSPWFAPETHEKSVPLGESKSIVYRLAALFSLDSFASGFAVQSMLALWLFERFDLSLATTGTIFFFTQLFAAGSYLLSARLARKIGLVNTMVFTHLPANLMLLAAPFMPTVELA
ncbi:MAG: MFS transporter, partial [Thermomicrobiales bacterium]